MGPDVLRIEVDNHDRIVSLYWPGEKASRYHFVWLRHHARCADGMPNDTSIKIDLLPDDPATLHIVSAQQVGDRIRIQWADGGLCTDHGLESLRTSAYDDWSRRRTAPRPRLWDRDSANEIPVFDRGALDDSRMLELLLTVRDFGVALLRGVSLSPGSVAEVAETFGPVHVNNYGRVFDVRTDTKSNLGSNTGAYLGPHTDEGYRHAPPGISFFHCIQAVEKGGDSILVDGFNAARVLEDRDPESFRILSTVPLCHQRFSLPEEDMRARGRVIVTDFDGNLEGIRFTDRTLPPQTLPEEWMEPVYRGIRAFWKIVNAKEMALVYHMQPGDLHVFDNQRVLHGRSAFDPDSGPRHLQQCSVNRDEFHNTLRTLAARLGHPAAQQSLAGGALG